MALTDYGRAGSSTLTTVTTSSSANTKGDWVELVSSNPAVTKSLYLDMTGFDAGDSGLIDIGVDPAGGTNYAVRVPNLLIRNSKTMTLSRIELPLKIESGASVAVRIQSQAGGSETIVAGLILGTESSLPSVSSFVAYGITDSGDSVGTAVDAGTSANTKSAWVELSASLPEDYIGACVIAYKDNTAVGSLTDYYLDVGIDEVVAIPNMWHRANSTMDATSIGNYSWVPQTFSTGDQLSIRIQASSTNAVDRILNSIGVYLGISSGDEPAGGGGAVQLVNSHALVG